MDLRFLHMNRFSRAGIFKGIYLIENCWNSDRRSRVRVRCVIVYFTS